jgi:hypothetical protein
VFDGMLNDAIHLWPIPLVVIAIAYSMLGAAAGHLAAQRKHRLIGVTSLVAGLLVGATVAFMWDPPYNSTPEISYFIALVLSLAVPAILPFSVAWLSVHRELARSTRLIATCLAGLVGLVAFPISCLCFMCGLAGECL